MQKNETGSLSYIIGKNKLKKDLNIRPKTIKLLGENIGSKLFDITLSNIFLDVSPQTRKTKKINKWHYIKLKRFCTAEETINKTKRQPNKGKDICQ